MKEKATSKRDERCMQLECRGLTVSPRDNMELSQFFFFFFNCAVLRSVVLWDPAVYEKSRV